MARTWLVRLVFVGFVLGAVWGTVDYFNLLKPTTAGKVVTRLPTADAYVLSSRATRNFGDSSSLRADSSPQMHSYLRFDLRGVENVEQAELEIFALSPQRGGISVYLTDNSWDENSVTFSNGPGPMSGQIGSSGSISANGWIKVNVTPAIRPGSVVNLVLMTSDSRQVRFSSRETGSTAPRLNIISSVDTSPGDPDVPTATNVSTATHIPTATSTSTATPEASPVSTDSPASTPTSAPAPGGGGTSLSFPIRAAFYYPWFPEAWDQGGKVPFTQFQPALGQYNTGDSATIRQHIDWMQYAGIEAGIASWWGPGHHTDADLQHILEASDDAGFKWAIYHEMEGYEDLSGTQIRSDLEYIRDTLATDADYLRIDGKFVVFVYNANDSSCDVAGRWMEAATEFDVHVVLKVFSGYRDCNSQPHSWHQYGPASATSHQRGYSYTISPGFWHAKDGSPRLERDLERWTNDVRAMTASNEPWQLITTFNEWGEGTSVEPAAEWGMSYLDALANNGEVPSSPSPTSTPPPDPTPTPTVESPPAPPGNSVTLTFAGDLGANDDSSATLATINAISPIAHFLPGDVSYSEISPESAWCTWVKNQTSVPIELLVGNHEEDGGPDGHIRNFTACMPDALGAVGDYGVQYYVDLPAVRVINIATDLDVDGHSYNYRPGDADRQWLEAAINGARESGQWVIVSQHKVCITIGVKSCEIGEELADYLAANADVIFMGHDHNYQRSHQLRCVDPNTVTQACIADADSDHQRGDGALFIINGAGGRDTAVNRGDNEAGYFAASMGDGDPGWGHGVVRVDISGAQISGTFVSSTGNYSDSFIIRR